MTLTCHFCKSTLSPSDYSRSDTCGKCGRATRCCMNCTFYNAQKYNECTEPVADRVVDKEKGNFCDYFKPGSPQKNDPAAAKSAALSAAEALFKKKS